MWFDLKYFPELKKETKYLCGLPAVHQVKGKSPPRQALPEKQPLPAPTGVSLVLGLEGAR